MSEINSLKNLSRKSSVARSQEKVCEYIFPLSNEELNRKFSKTKKNSITERETESRSKPKTGGGESVNVRELNSSLRHTNKSYTDTGGIYIYLFRNNDPFFLGKKMLITEKLYRNWEQFIISVIKNVELVNSSCRIFDLTGREIEDCSELIDGGKYIVTCKTERLNLNINYRTSKENKEYQLQKGMEEQKKHLKMNEKYRKKKNHWIYQKEQQRLNDLENKREVIEQGEKEKRIEYASKKRELLKKIKIERIDQEERRIRFKQKNRENGNYVINQSLVTIEPEKVFDRESKGYRIYLHKNGDYYSTGTRFILNFNNSSSLLAMIINIRETFPSEFWFARRIFDINTCKRIQKIEEIVDENHYIITGKELLRKEQMYRTETEEVTKIDPIIIHVYPNGDALSIPTNIRVTSQKFPTFEKLIRYIDGNMHLITGCIKILYNMSGKKITSIEQLENEQEYVAASYNEPFYNIKYNINAYKKNRRRNDNKNNTLNGENNGNNEENNNNSKNGNAKIANNDDNNDRNDNKSESVNIYRSMSKDGNENEGRSRSITENMEYTKVSHSRSASDHKNINKADPECLRKVKTEQGSTLRSERINKNSRPQTSKEEDKTISNEVNEAISNEVDEVIPNEVDEVISNEIDEAISRPQSSKKVDEAISSSQSSNEENEEKLKQFTSRSSTTNHNLALPRKSED
ncbi:hypothetical protein H8356DRAFT_940857 [Neocallimastix lanati (nom. inval.)]|nr:hypothetical protein H8356DRAFT_940857 [Neocallimastix sp. JGI-2020a]